MSEMSARVAEPTVAITVDVKTSDSLDRLMLMPRRMDEAHEVAGALRRGLNDARVVRSADGISVAAEAADQLLEGVRGLSLRWTPSASLVAQNRRRVRALHDDMVTATRRVIEAGPAAARQRFGDDSRYRVLDDHQVVNVRAMTLPGGYGLCLFDEQGTGKTVTMIYAFDRLVELEEVDFALVVAPKSMVPEWPNDFERFAGGLYRVEVAAGTRREKERVLRSGADVVVTNFETAVGLEDNLVALLRRYQGRAVLVVDESFYIKNLDAARTRAIRRLREFCGRAFVLCGTPAPNSPHDLVQQFTLVDFGRTFAGVDLPPDRAAAVPVAQRAIEERGIFVRHLKNDVLPDLPERRFEKLIVQMEPLQATLYRRTLDELILELRGTDEETFRREITSFFAQRSVLLQLCSHPSAVVPGYSETPAKLRAMDELLEDLVCRRGEKVVIWSFYTASIDALVQRYSTYGVVRYDGSVADVSERRNAVRMFQEDDETMVFIANPAAAGAGLTLHRSRVAVYESLSNQAAHYLQSLDRIHRRGQDRRVEYLVLLCEGSIEVQEYQRLLDKQRTAQELLGDPVTPRPTRETMLAEAEQLRRLLGRSD